MTFFKKMIILAILIQFIMPSALLQAAPQKSKPTLQILNWSDYIDFKHSKKSSRPLAEQSDTLQRFMAKYNCNIQYDEYSDTDDLLGNISKFESYDLVIVANIELPFFIKKKLISKLDKPRLPNLKHIDKMFNNLFTDPKGDYSVPYLVGTTGLIYRKDLTGGPVYSLKKFFEDSTPHHYRVGMYNDPEVVFPFTLLYLGEKISADNIKGINKANRVLFRLKQSGRVGLCSSDNAEIGRNLLSGKIAMSIMYSGDALQIISKNPSCPLAYVLPEEGGEFYVDSFVIPTASSHKKLAHDFINFVLKPANHAAIATAVKYCSPNKASIAIIGKKHGNQLTNPAIYPPQDILNKLHFFLGFNKSPLTRHYWQQLWQQKR